MINKMILKGAIDGGVENQYLIAQKYYLNRLLQDKNSRTEILLHLLFLLILPQLICF